MSGRFSIGDFARAYIQEARRSILSSLPENLPQDLRKALGATTWLLEIVKNVQMAHTRNKALDAIRQHEICVQSEELFREGISEAKDAVALVLDEIRLTAVDRDIVSFGKVSEVTAFDVVLKEADRTLALVDMAKSMKAELADTLSSYFPSPPPFEKWKSLRAKLEKESLRVSSRRLKKTDDLPVLSDSAAIAYEILLELEPYKGLKGTELLQVMDNRGYPTDQSSLTSRIIPELKLYGVENVPRKGYRIPESKRPAS